MTWVLIYDGRTVCRGTREECLDAGDRLHLIERTFHKDNTELAPRITSRGVALIPARMARLGRRAAA